MAETNYEFLDSGGGRRLERIGEILIDRPAPQAQWPKGLAATVWQDAQARFIRNGQSNGWDLSRLEERSEPLFEYRYESIRMELRFSENGQIGVYPEQLDNWRWIRECVRSSKDPLRILNGFAYTGGASLFAVQGGLDGPGADLCHLDASKSAVSWAGRNRELSFGEKGGIRFIVEDILRFMDREIKRGREYDGLILDPPAFGRAPGQKTWVLKRDFPALMERCSRLLSRTPRFILVSCHDPAVRKDDLAEGLRRMRGVERGQMETLDLILPSERGMSLPNGIAVRWRRD